MIALESDYMNAGNIDFCLLVADFRSVIPYPRNQSIMQSVNCSITKIEILVAINKRIIEIE